MVYTMIEWEQNIQIYLLHNLSHVIWSYQFIETDDTNMFSNKNFSWHTDKLVIILIP